MTLGQVFAAAALVGIEWRYRYPLDPMINVLIGAGIAGLATRGIRLWRQKNDLAATIIHCSVPNVVAML